MAALENDDNNGSDAASHSLPPGAREILQAIAAERILHLTLSQLLKRRRQPSKGARNVGITAEEAFAIQSLVIQFPALARKLYCFQEEGGGPSSCNSRNNGNEKHTEWYPLTVLVQCQPPLSLIQTVWNTLPKDRVSKVSSHLLHHACEHRASLEVVEFLHKVTTGNAHKPNKPQQHNWHPLHLACRHQQASRPVIQFLLQQDPQAVWEREELQGCLPLHLAVLGGAAVEILELLVYAMKKEAKQEHQHIMDPYHLCDGSNRTPLHYACRYARGNLPMIAYLVNIMRPASIHETRTPQEGPMTPLQLAAAFQPPQVLEYLLRHCSPAVATTTNPTGWTLLHLAVKCNTATTVEFLASRFPHMTKARRFDSHFTPLHNAADRLYAQHSSAENETVHEIVQALVRHNRNPLTMSDRLGRFPLDVALENAAEAARENKMSKGSHDIRSETLQLLKPF